MNKTLLIGIIILSQTFSLHAKAPQLNTQGNSLYSNSEYNMVVDNAQKNFRKKLQRRCGYTAGHFAQFHTKKEWIEIHKQGNFIGEFSKLCPKGVVKLKESWVEPLFLFSEKYARDSGEKPRC